MPDLYRNRLLASIPPKSLREVGLVLQRVDLAFKQSLAEPDEPIDHVYFPELGVCSAVMETQDGSVIEVATIGHEGMVNTPILLGTDTSPTRTFCQIPGPAYRVSSGDLRDLMDADPAFRQTLLRYTQAMIIQIAQSATCNRVHNIEERAARWLLSTHDRVEGDTFPLTQEFLGQMLGVRRQAVNVAAGMLQQAGLISYVRGSVTVLDRPGLEAASCECYEIILREYARLLGDPNHRSPSKGRSRRHSKRAPARAPSRR